MTVRARPPLELRALGLSAALALTAGVGLAILWSRFGPAGAFARGLTGHSPDPNDWLRLLAGWLPAAHLAFGFAYVLLDRWRPAARLRRHFVADQAALILVLPLAAALVLRGGGSRPNLLVPVGGTWRCSSALCCPTCFSGRT